ncbi:YdcF family protein [Tsukamurella sp. TY48]|uniref:YdcF family protein n=1 Tax=Tsukamurella sp. TY48 TaxID=2775495 RepID=UPI002101D723|nr:YdcF family protein [Tsukamurella sp. TY48]
MRSGRLSRRGAIVAAVVVVVLALVATMVDRAYVAPRTADQLARADAIVVLGGNPYDRFEYGLELASRGLAPQVVLSNSVGAADSTMQELCDRPIRDVSVTCFLPVPWTTRGEAQELNRLAAERNWRSVIVVTTTAHVERARFILERCSVATLQMTDFPERRALGATVYGWAYQTAGWLKALTQTGC